MSKNPTVDSRRGLSEYIKYAADRSSTENSVGNRVKKNGSIGRTPRKECFICGGKMFSFRWAICYSCSQKKVAEAREKPNKLIEAGKAILAIEARKKEIAAARRKK